MRWLYKLEYKFGRYYIKNLMLIIVAGMAGVYLLDMFGAAAGISVSRYLTLDSAAIFSGQVWRLITFVFVYPSSGAFFVLISLYFYYMMGRLLESSWSGFKLNLYYLFGMLGVILGTLLGHLLLVTLPGHTGTVYGSNTYLNLSLFLAVATIMPDTQFMLFFIIPIKAKWMAIAYAVLLVVPLVFQAITSPIAALYALIQLAFSLLNYLVFFGPTLVNSLKEQRRIAANRRNWRNNNKNWRQ